MDLIAGDSREILLAITIDDWHAFNDRDRFDAHLSLGAGLDPTWLDLFSEAARTVTGNDEPQDFLDARRDMDTPPAAGDRTIERVDPAWITAVARIPERHLSAVASRWIDLVEEELGDLADDEKPWIRTLAGEVVRFARESEDAATVLFAWSL
jgi:hypothetical protein